MFKFILANFSSEIYGLPSISKVKSCKFGIKAAVSTGNSSLSGDLLREVPCPMSDFCVVKIIIIKSFFLLYIYYEYKYLINYFY